MIQDECIPLLSLHIQMFLYSFAIRSRSTFFCTLPVDVFGNSDTKSTYMGTANCTATQWSADLLHEVKHPFHSPY